MKTISILAAAVLAFGTSSGEAEALEVGQTPEQVVASLGYPSGRMATHQRMVWVYPQGSVTFVEGQVAAFEIRSPEQMEALAAVRAEREAARAEADLRRVEQGVALLDRTLTDPAFLRQSAADQVAFWRRFRQHYPEVDISRPYGIALAEHTADLSAAREFQVRDAEIRRLEAQVADAERRAADAEWTSRSGYGSAIASYIYTPVVRTVYRRPVVVVPDDCYKPPHRPPPPRQVVQTRYMSGAEAVSLAVPPRSNASDILTSERTQGAAPRPADESVLFRGSVIHGGIYGQVRIQL